jgi:hypothetical protein
LGTAVGALASTWYAGDTFGSGGCILIPGIVFVPSRLECNADRYAGITFAVIMLVPGHRGPIRRASPVL